ncbi:hypothetical protein GJV85_00610 [Sulfurimonas aquatica]|uniref:Uncharacterized protein n=1 Tax=Sulfurimonas aquatica TaxID=2672570 RepID=A0A975AY04_9BACT|nr:hypothetical protein [Sulfurimonas aquatica]QSZ40681.1 hypothetical protein GJV85_00610 [Sulfurimonas aquatica]
MKNILLIILINALRLSAMETETLHSSASVYYENINFSNSLQKENGNVYGVGADLHYGVSELQVTYERGETNTIQPPLSDDLKTDKLFFKYGHKINEKLAINLHSISILNDNIAITDKGQGYGVGLEYSFSDAFSTSFTQYYSDYYDFDVYQSDIKLAYKVEIDKFHMKFSSITKYINIDESNANIFTKNAKENYLTSGLKFHSHYQSYHFGFGAYFGERIFAIMNDGLKVQHHSMRIDRTYVLGIGKNISDFVLRAQYIFQRAEELPLKNKNVYTKNTRFIVSHKF